MFSSFWKVFCTGEDSGQRRPIIRIKRSPLEKPQASQNQVTRVFSFVLILSTPPPEKKVDQNVVLCKDIGVNITQIENIEVRRVYYLRPARSVCPRCARVFSKGFPLHAEQNYFERHEQQTTFDTKSKSGGSAHFVKFWLLV